MRCGGGFLFRRKTIPKWILTDFGGNEILETGNIDQEHLGNGSNLTLGTTLASQSGNNCGSLLVYITLNYLTK